jgi:hypothetical protein
VIAESKFSKQRSEAAPSAESFPNALVIKVIAWVPYTSKVGCQVTNVLFLTDAMLVLCIEGFGETKSHGCSGV